MDLNAIMISQVPPGGYATAITLTGLHVNAARTNPACSAPLAALVAALAAALAADDIPGPLWQPLTFACVWTDLARLAGVEPPAEVAALAYGDTVEIVTH